MLSFQYAIAYGVCEDGMTLEPIAIYDKTFREPQWPTSGGWREKLAVGALTKKDIHERHMAQSIRTANNVLELLSFIFEEKIHPCLETVMLAENFFVDPKNDFQFKEGVVHSQQETSRHVHFFDIDWLHMQGNPAVREFFSLKVDNSLRHFIFEQPAVSPE